jgi:CRISPR-associated protein Cas1
MEETLPAHGTLTVWGYGAKIHVSCGHLLAEWGICDERYSARLPRVNHSLERLVLLDPDGYLSFEALDWLINQKVHVLFVNRDGDMLGTIGPPRPREASLVRAQVRAAENGAGLSIARSLIEYKLAGQERIARSKLRNAACADAIASFRAGLPAVVTMDAIRYLEAQGAASYWQAWRALPVTFPRSEIERTPSYWQTFGSRQSVLTGSPRAAINPANAMLNYTYTILLFESVIALTAMGLDPGLGYLHLDAVNRYSLACDVMEAVRPEVDGYLLDWLITRPLKREWFRESRGGQCLLRYDLCSILCETASIWRAAIAPWAEWIAHMLWIAYPEQVKRPATRLTGRRRREVNGAPPMPPAPAGPKAQSVCKICGTSIRSDRKYCGSCAATFQSEQIREAAKSAGTVAAHSAQATVLRSESARHNALARSAWDPSSLPDWLTPEAFIHRIQPLLANVTTSAIATALGVSWVYASHIRAGAKRPHARHWMKLGELVGLGN